MVFLPLPAIRSFSADIRRIALSMEPIDLAHASAQFYSVDKCCCGSCDAKMMQVSCCDRRWCHTLISICFWQLLQEFCHLCSPYWPNGNTSMWHEINYLKYSQTKLDGIFRLSGRIESKPHRRERERGETISEPLSGHFLLSFFSCATSALHTQA